MQTPEDSKDDIPIPPNGEWFTSDLRAIKLRNSEPHKQHESWYNKFTSVANTVITQIILLRNGYQTRGGKITYYSDEACRQLIMRIPTAPWSGDTPYPEFPLHDMSIYDWVDHFKASYAHLNASPSAMSSPDLRNDFQIQLDRDFALADQVTDVPPEQMDDAVEFGYHAEEEARGMLAHSIVAAGIEPESFLESDFMQAALCPLVPVRDPEWTPWLSKMAVSNIYGQLTLMYRRCESFQAGMELLALHCETEKERLQEEKETLEKKAVAVRKAKEVLSKIYGDGKGMRGDVQTLRTEVESGSRNPQVRDFVDRYRPHISDPSSGSVVRTLTPRSSKSPALYNSSTYASTACFSDL